MYLLKDKQIKSPFFHITSSAFEKLMQGPNNVSVVQYSDKQTMTVPLCDLFTVLC